MAIFALAAACLWLAHWHSVQPTPKYLRLFSLSAVVTVTATATATYTSNASKVQPLWAAARSLRPSRSD